MIPEEQKKLADQKKLAYNRQWAHDNRDKRNLYRKRWMDKNPEKHLDYVRNYRAAHPEMVKAATNRRYLKHRSRLLVERARYRAENPEKVAASKRAFHFGRDGHAYWLTQHAAQNGKCAICGRTGEETARALGLDHNHDFKPKDPKGWRGLLCKYCNAGIGNFNEDMSLFAGAAHGYLAKWGAKRQPQPYL